DEYYSINLAEEVKRGMLERVTRGEAVSVAPFGYKMVDKQLIINTETAPIVKMIFNEYICGSSKTQLARKLNELGIKTIRGNNWDNRGIEYLLNNPVYIGKIRWTPTGKTRRNYNNPDTMIVDGGHEPIITNEVFEKAKSKSNEVSRKYPKYARTTPCDFMLRGILRCSNCNATLTMAAGGKYLQCHRYNKGQCQVSHSIAINKINKIVLSAIETSFATGVFMLEIKSKPVEQVTINYSELIAKEEIKLKRAREAYEAGVYDLLEYSESKKTIQERIFTLKNQMAQQPVVDTNTLKKKFIEKHKETLQKLKSNDISETDKNELIRTFVDHIVFSRSTCSVSVYFYI
ncbi:MAG: recombinase family protein, partial [Acutalibacteraceae bacterium]